MTELKEHYAVDLDGTLLEYDGWHDQDHYGKPFPGAIEWIEARLKEGHEVTIFTARENHAQVKEYLLSQGFPELNVTNIKSPKFSIIIDDRAVRFDNPKIWSYTKDHFPLTLPWWKRL